MTVNRRLQILKQAMEKMPQDSPARKLLSFCVKYPITVTAETVAETVESGKIDSLLTSDPNTKINSGERILFAQFMVAALADMTAMMSV